MPAAGGPLVLLFLMSPRMMQAARTNADTSFRPPYTHTHTPKYPSRSQKENKAFSVSCQENEMINQTICLIISFCYHSLRMRAQMSWCAFVASRSCRTKSLLLYLPTEGLQCWALSVTRLWVIAVMPSAGLDSVCHSLGTSSAAACVLPLLCLCL